MNGSAERIGVDVENGHGYFAGIMKPSYGIALAVLAMAVSAPVAAQESVPPATSKFTPATKLPAVPPPPAFQPLPGPTDPAPPRLPLVPPPVMPQPAPGGFAPPAPRLPLVPPPESQPQPLPAPSPLPKPPPAGRFVLLKDQRLIEGEVQLGAEAITVRRGAVDHEFPRADVLFIGATRDEVYQYQRKFVGDKDVEGHLKLAKWCAYSGMREEALAEARAAASLDPANGSAQQMVRSLEESLRRFPPPGTKPPPPVIPPATARPPLPQTPATPVVQPVAVADQEVPAAIAVSFRTKVQPVLTNLCVSCHGRPEVPAFKLARMLEWDTSPASLIQNVKATLALLSRDDPASSRFLAMALTQHGGMREPAIASDKSPAYKTLLEWVHTASHLAPAPPPPPAPIAQAPAVPESLVPALPPAVKRTAPAAPAGIVPLPPVSAPPSKLPAVPPPPGLSRGVKHDAIVPVGAAAPAPVLPPAKPKDIVLPIVSMSLPPSATPPMEKPKPPEPAKAAPLPIMPLPPAAPAPEAKTPASKNYLVVPIEGISLPPGITPPAISPAPTPFAADVKPPVPTGPNGASTGMPVDEFDPSLFNRASNSPGSTKK